MSEESRQHFSELLQRHRGVVYKVAHSYAWTPEDRADLAQEIATQLWRAFPGYDGRRPFPTWMYRVALNVAISQVRREERQRRQRVTLDVMPDVVDESAASPESLVALEQLQKVIAAQDPLNRALVLLYLDDYGNREIGDILGLTETNVSTRISRLKQRIRERMK
ncbi:MAG: sigma-70 family RNA polymerase sigma factor [Lysobacteraceae bacterium]